MSTASMTAITKPAHVDLPPAKKLLHVQALFSPIQLEAIKAAKILLKEAFPRQSDIQIAEFFAAATITLPEYSTLDSAKVADVASTMIGVTTLCYGHHPVTDELAIVLIRRSEIGIDGEHQYGVIGGHANPGYYALGKGGYIACPDEQPPEGGLRENREELLDDQGKPILNLDLSRLEIIDEGIDVRSLAKGHLATHYSNYAAFLTDEEMQRVFEHSERMHKDPTYSRAVQEHSKGEIMNIEMLNLREAANLKPEQFTHPHELIAVQKLYSKVKDIAVNPHSLISTYAPAKRAAYL